MRVIKASIYSAVLLFGMSLTSFSSPKINSEKNLSQLKLETVVYVCGGKYSTKFHSTTSCRGLNNCSTDIYKINSIQEAQKRGYSSCKICWQ